METVGSEPEKGRELSAKTNRRSGPGGGAAFPFAWRWRARTYKKGYVADIIIAGLIVCLAFAVFYPFTFIGVDPHHDGIMLKTALDLVAGQTLFRETFNQYGALASYLQAWFLSLTSPTLWNLRLLTLLTYAAIAGFQYFSAALYIPRTLAVAATLFWMALAPFLAPQYTLLPWSSVFAIFFQLAGLIFFQYGTRRDTREGRLLFLSGLSIGLAFLCRQTVGLLSLIALMGAVLAVGIHPSRNEGSRAAGLKRLLPLFGGFAATIAGFLVENHHANRDWWFQTVTWPRMWAAGKGAGFSRICNSLFWSWQQGTRPLVGLFLLEITLLVAIFFLGRKFPKTKWPLAVAFSGLAIYWARCTALWGTVEWGGVDTGVPLISIGIEWGGLATGMPLVLLGAFFVLWIMRTADRRLELMALASVGVASWHQFYPINDNRHLFWGISLAIGPTVYLLYRAFNSQLIPSLLAVVALTHPMFIKKYEEARVKLTRQYVTLREPPILAGMKVLPQEVAAIGPHMTELHKLAQRYPDKPFLLEGMDPFVLTLARNLKNPSPFYVTWGFEPQAAERRTEFLLRYQPIVIVEAMHFPYVAPRLYEFHYHLLYKDPGTKILIYGPSM